MHFAYNRFSYQFIFGIKKKNGVFLVEMESHSASRNVQLILVILIASWLLWAIYVTSYFYFCEPHALAASPKIMKKKLRFFLVFSFGQER